MNHFLKFSVITVITIGMMFIRFEGITNNDNGFSKVIALSHSATVQKQFQPSFL